MTSNRQRSPKRSIPCPACKTRQPLTHTCTSCGFDIKAHALRVAREGATKKTEQIPPAKKSGPVATPGGNPPVKRRDLVCPSCATRQPFTHVCASCGFDIKEYVLNLKNRKATKTPNVTGSSSGPETVAAPATDAPPSEAHAPETLPPELFDRAEREIMSLFMVESPSTAGATPAKKASSVPSDESIIAASSHLHAPSSAEMKHAPEATGDFAHTPSPPELPKTGPEAKPRVKAPRSSPVKTKSPDRARRPAPPSPKKTPRPKPAAVRRTPPPPPPPLYPERQTPGPAELLSQGELTRSAWEHYRKRAPLLTQFWLIALAGAAAPMGVAMGLGSLIAWLVPGIERQVITLAGMAGIPVALLAMSPGLGALVAAIADPTADRTVALYRGKRLWRATATVLLLTAGIAAGGSILLVVPAMLACIGAGLALYITFIERETGIVSFIKSFEYLKERTADSMLKLTPVAVMCILTVLLFRLVPPAGIFLIVVLLICMPYLMVYLHRMFENLRGVKGRIVFFQVSRHVRMRWTAAALAGASVPLVLALLIWQLGHAANAFHLLASLI